MNILQSFLLVAAQIIGTCHSPPKSNAYQLSATGPTKEAKLIPDQFLGAIQIMFDLQPTSMSFDLPWTMWLVNPAFVVPNWNVLDGGIRFELDGKVLKSGVDYRVGLEQTEKGKDLVIWLNKTIDLNAREDHRVEISMSPVSSK